MFNGYKITVKLKQRVSRFSDNTSRPRCLDVLSGKRALVENIFHFAQTYGCFVITKSLIKTIEFKKKKLVFKFLIYLICALCQLIVIFVSNKPLSGCVEISRIV